MNSMINTKNYRLVEQNTKDNSKNLIKVTQKGKPMNYALYACKQLFSKKQKVVVIQGMGQASSKVISAVEFMRKRVPNLHVAYEIGSLESSRVYESLKEEHDRVTTTKNIPYLSAHVTLSEPQDIQNMVGYMKPLPEEELLQQERFKEQIEQYEPRDRLEVPQQQQQQQHQQQMKDQKPKHQFKKYKKNMNENKHYGVKGQHNNPKGYQRTKQPKMTGNDDNRNNNQGNRSNNQNNRGNNRNNRGGFKGNRGNRGQRGGRGNRGNRNNRGHRGGRGGRGGYNRNDNN